MQGFSNITHLLSILLVSMEEIRPIINKKIPDVVTVTRGSRACDFGNPYSDEFTEAAGLPGVFYVWGTRSVMTDCIF